MTSTAAFMILYLMIAVVTGVRVAVDWVTEGDIAFDVTRISILAFLWPAVWTYRVFRASK